MKKDESIHSLCLTLRVAVIIGPDCDGGKELRKVRFVDIEDGMGIDIKDYEKNGVTVAQRIEDVLGDKLLQMAIKKIDEIEP